MWPVFLTTREQEEHKGKAYDLKIFSEFLESCDEKREVAGYYSQRAIIKKLLFAVKKKKKEFMSSHLSKPFVKVSTAISQRIFKDSLPLTTRNFRSTRYFCIKIRISKYCSICIKPCFQSLPCLFIVDIIKRKLQVSLKIWILWSFLWSCCQNNRTAWSQRYIIQYLQQQQSLLCSWYKKCKDIKRK